MNKIKDTFKSMMSLFMALLMLLGVSPTNAFAQTINNASLSVGDEIKILTDGYISANWVKFKNGSVFNTERMYFTHNDAGRIEVYCVDHRKAGTNALKQAGREHNVKIEKFTSYKDAQSTSPKGGINASELQALLNSGFPNKTPAELGLSSEQEAYFATRLAIAMWVNYPPSTFSGVDQTGNKIIEAAKKIAYLDGGIVPFSANLSEIPQEEINTYKTFQLEDGSILELSDKEAKDTAILYRNARARLSTVSRAISTQSKSELSFGDPTDKTSVFTSGKNREPQPVVFMMPPEDVSNYGQFKIVKTDGTNKLAGAEFKIEGPSFTPSENITIPSSGEWTSEDVIPGIYTITESKAPDGYKIASNPTQTVEVNANQSSPATVTFVNTPQDGGLRIIKTNMDNSKRLSGATFEVRDKSGDVVKSGLRTNTNGEATVTGLSPATYTVVETSPPKGYALANPTSQTVEVKAGQTSLATVTFANPEKPDEPEPPSTGVKIQKIDALSRENIPGALVRLRGISAGEVITGGTVPSTGDTHWVLDNTGINISQVLTSGATTALPKGVTSTVTDGVWTLEGLPYGAYIVEEERAPHNYSLLPQHTSYGFWLLPPAVNVDVSDVDVIKDENGNVLETIVDYEIKQDGKTSSILITFENYPYGKIELEKIDEVTGKPLAGAEMRIVGYFPEGNENGIPTDRTATTDQNGKITWDNLPAGLYSITEVFAPEGYILSKETLSVPLTWGQTATVSFKNTPKTSLEVLKIDANTGATLEGAIFMLTDKTNGETWQATTGSDGKAIFGAGSLGNELVAGKLYILTEIQAPSGYILESKPHEIVLKNTGVNTYTIKNWKNPSLTIVKRDKNNGQPRLEGAVFEVSYENGQTVTGSPFTTNKDGEIVIDNILFDDQNERTLVITEKVPPNGFNLSNPNWQRVTVRKGEDNVVVFENTRKPTLTIHKVDATNGKNLEGAEFTIEKLEEPGKGMLTGNPFRTDTNGKITLEYQYSGKYRIVETKAPNNYWFDPLQQNREWIIEVKENEDYALTIKNTILPTLIVTKWNAVTYKPVPLTHFKVEYEVPNSGNVELVGEFVTNKNGQIVLPYVKVGWYRVTETRPAPGMSLNTSNSYRIYLAPGNNSYMPIPSVTENNPNLNPEMPLFKDIKVFGGNDFFLASAAKYEFPENSLVVKGEANETFTLYNSDKGKSSRSNVQIDVNSNVVGEFKADSSGILVLSDLEKANYSVARDSKESKTISIKNDGSVTMVEFTKTSATVETPTVTPTPKPAPSPTPTSPTVMSEEDLKNIDLNAIEMVQDKALVQQVSKAMAVNGGDTYYNTGTGVWNYPLNSIVIKKTDATNGRLLAGATFDLIYTSSGKSGTRGTVIGSYTTNFSGIIVITGLEPGAYVVEETKPPTNYMLSVNNRQTAYLKPDGHSIIETEFSNYPYGSLLITKTDEITGKPLANAEFKVTTSDGTVVGTNNGRFVTNQQGEIVIPNLKPDSYIITETKAATGYVIGENATQTITIRPDGQVFQVNFTNRPLSSLTVRKLDSFDNSPIKGAKFRVERQNGEFVGEYETDTQGLFSVNGILGWVKVIEIDPASGFVMGDAMQTAEIKASEPTVLTFYNAREGGLTIEKLDQDGKPLSAAKFRITKQNGEFVGTYTSNTSGIVNVGQLNSGWYVVEETQAPLGYVISDVAQSVEIKPNAQANVTFVNKRIPALVIEKVDGNGKPLQGAEFEIRKLDDGLVTRVTSDKGGVATVSELAPGSYKVVESRAPRGYVAENTSQVIEIKAGETRTIRFVNVRMSETTIKKVDGETNIVIPNVAFEIRHMNGEIVKNPIDGTTLFVTNQSGLIHLPNLTAGSYVATETKAVEGYTLAEPKYFAVKDGENQTIIIENFKMRDTVIKKIDGDTEQVLAGVQFEIANYVGSSASDKLRNAVDGSYIFTTDKAGLIKLPTLPKGSYIATEVKPLEGYSKAEPVVFTVGNDIEYNNAQTIIIKNYKKAELTIKKINSQSREALEGVIFQISKPNGERLVNPKTGMNDFVTDRNGLIYLPVVEDGNYWLTETKALESFIAKPEPMLVTIDSSARQKEHLLVVENTPASGLRIIKTDAQTKKPLAGVIFEIRHADGKIVQGNILDGNQPSTKHNSPQLNDNNGFTTDERGRINLNHLAPGVYHVTEKKPLNGYELDTKVHVVTVQVGKQAVLEVENTPLSGLRIKKTDAITGQPIFGVEFMLFDQNGKVVGNFYSDNRGIVEFPALLVAGRYTIRETRPAAGYAEDNIPKTVDFVPGKVTEIEWTNMPMGGQLQISKVSGDHNEQNALSAGTPLAGAIFEIYSFKTGNLVDRIISDHRGMAVSKPLPLGRYYAMEVTAPAYYKINPQKIDFDVEFDRQIVKVSFPNYSANLGVTINKVGPREAMQGHNIFYDIKTVRNDSSVPLTDFFWRDVLPVNAVRADKLVTGTYNQSLKYKVLGKTNKGNEIVIADNLWTTKNNVVELKPVHLGLSKDEYLVEFTLYFGTVPAGFTAVDKPKIYVDVLAKNHGLLPNGLMFANKVDIGGKVAGSNEWVIGNSTTATTIFNPGRIPKSGY